MNKIIQLLAIHLCIASVAIGQKANYKTSDLGNWEELKNPLISPNGKYISYCLENRYNETTKLTVQSRDNKWSKSIIYKTRFNFSQLDNQRMIIQCAEDSLAIITLGGNIAYKPSFNGYKAPRNKSDVIALSRRDSLILETKYKKEAYDSISSFYFTDNGNQLILIKKTSTPKTHVETICSVDLNNMKESIIWKGSSIQNFKPNKSFDKIAFITDEGANLLKNLVAIDLKTNEKKTIQLKSLPNFEFDEIKSFYNDSLIIVSIMGKKSLEPINNGLDLTVWRYTDDRTAIENEGNGEKKYLAVLNLRDGSLIQLEFDRENWNGNGQIEDWGRYCIISKTTGDCFYAEVGWNEACKKTFYQIDLLNGERKELNKLSKKNVFNNYEYSPDKKFVVYYDLDSSRYYCLNIEKNTEFELTNNNLIRIFNNRNTDIPGYLKYPQRGIAGWDIRHNRVYIYDYYDIWEFDMKGLENPKNITQGYGQTNNIIFSFLNNDRPNIINDFQNEILVALNDNTKFNGFYKIEINNIKPKLLTMGPYLYYMPHYSVERNGMKPIKASESNTFIVQRESASSHPNYFLTDDFTKFTDISNYYPEKKYNWITTELHTWKTKDGITLNGILYKPENFDSTKKYPVIFNIYELQSNEVNSYIPPDYLCNGCRINPALTVNEGFLVFKPDIHYKADLPGESSLLAIESAAKYLSGFKWIDKSNLGLQGCSFGGYETNYIVTHSTLFKAACTASGATDIMSWASQMYKSIFTSFFFQQFRMKSKFWSDYSPFYENSPLYKANDVSCPLLIFHTTIDGAVPFNQGIQFFLTLRRLGKPTWLLQYGGTANHGVSEQTQQIDFSNKMMEFYKHYLKSNQTPEWMRSK